MEKFSELFEETLKDIYYAEKAILKALPKMAKKASSRKLEAAFTKHQKETERQVERLEEVFGLLGKRAAGKELPCHRRHHRRGRGGHEGSGGRHHPRRRDAGRGPVGRALRDLPLWHAHRVGREVGA